MAVGPYDRSNATTWQPPSTAAPAQPLFDSELGQIFIQMRSILGLGLWDMARAVGGQPTVIADLEAGALSALPPWQELSRLIHEYARLSDIDPQPILMRLAQVHAPARTAARADYPPAAAPERYQQAPPRQAGYMPERVMPRPAPSVIDATVVPRTVTAPYAAQGRAPYPMATAAVVDVTPPPRTSGRLSPVTQAAITSDVRRGLVWRLQRGLRSTARGAAGALGRRIVWMAPLLAFPVLLFALAWLAPGAIYRLAEPLPGILRRPLRAVADMTVAATAPTREGLKWIDISDPRLRKTARLPAGISGNASTAGNASNGH